MGPDVKYHSYDTYSGGNEDQSGWAHQAVKAHNVHEQLQSRYSADHDEVGSSGATTPLLLKRMPRWAMGCLMSYKTCYVPIEVW